MTDSSSNLQDNSHMAEMAADLFEAKMAAKSLNRFLELGRAKSERIV